MLPGEATGATAAEREPALRPVSQPVAPPSRRLLQASDLPWMLGLMALGLTLRLIWWSGYGLGDDIIFRHGIAHLLTNKNVSVDNQAYRFLWWLPTALSCRAFGVGEVPMILPITITDTLGIGLVYLFGKHLYGVVGGVIAALLLIFCPLDFAWSTMITSDIMVSFVSALAILLVLRALQNEDRDTRRRCWVGAGICLWLAYHGKVSAVLLMPAIAVICLLDWRRVDRQIGYLIGTAGLFLGMSALVSYVFAGDPIAPYHAELFYQGLTGPQAVDHRMSADVFWSYVHWLFKWNTLGNLYFSVYPHLLVAFVAVGWLLGLRTSGAVFWWLLFFFVGMQFNIQRVSGVWISGFRNVRHGHAFVYPIILLLTGYLVGLRRRFPAFTNALLVVLLAFSAWQSVSAASKTKVSFQDRRQACRLLASLPPKSLYSDFQIPTWCAIVGVKEPEWRFPQLHSFDGKQRKAQLAQVTSGYAVTGGGREPYYGCWDCIPQSNEIDPAQWKLLAELEGPAKPTAWRQEPLRVWERIETPPPAMP